MLRARYPHRFVGTLLLLLLIALVAAPANAALRVAADQWLENADAAPEARRRATRWAELLGLPMVQVLSTEPDDRFAETIAVYERDEPVHERVFADPERALVALTAMVDDLVEGAAPVASELRTLPSGERIVWAQWIVDDLAYECVLAPSGATTSLIVTAVLASQVGSERAELDRIYAGVAGLTAPMPEFSLTQWRWGSIAIWLGLAVGLHLLMLAFVDRHRDHRQAGMRAALVLLPLVGIGTLASQSMLASRELALTHAGTSVAGLMTWIGVTGLCVVMLHVLFAQSRDRGVVRSAPTSGAFASGTYSTADMVRSTIQRAALRDPSASSGAWARPRRLDPDDPNPTPSPYDTSESQPIILADEGRLPPTRRS